MHRFSIRATMLLACVAAQSFTLRPLVAAQPGCAPAATPTSRPLGLHFHTSADATLIDASTAGQGQVGLKPPVSGGMSTFPLSRLSPDFTGSTIIVEQRLTL